MKTTEVTVKIIEASEGMILRRKNDKTIISKRVSLSGNDSLDNWEEVLEVIGISEKEIILQQLEENE